MNKEDKAIKENLLNELLSLEGNHKTEKIAELKEKFLKHISKNEYTMMDDELQDGLRIIKLYEEEAKHNDFNKLCKIANPVLYRLVSLDNWNARDLEFLSVVISYTETVDQAQILFRKAFKELEKYESFSEWNSNTKASIYNSFSVRLFRMNSFEIPKYTDLFEQTIKDALNFFEKNNFKLHKSLMLITKGVFFDDKNSIDEGLSKLKESGEHKAYEIMLQTIEYYKKRREI